MKSLTIITALFFTLTTAHARSVQNFLDADIIATSTSGVHPVSNKMVLGGKISINFYQKLIKLELRIKTICPPGAYCIAVMDYPKFFQLKIKSSETDSCGIVKYTARNNKMSADGSNQTLTITDYSRNTCIYAGLRPMTTFAHEFKYFDRINGKVVKGILYGQAEELR